LKTFIFISALCWSAAVTAQTPDSLKSKIKYPFAESFYEKDFFPDNILYTPIDTSFDEVQRYFPGNFPYSLGLANRKLIFGTSSETHPSANPIGFRSGISSLDLFGYTKDVLKYYRTRAPYTEIFGVFGMRREQFSRLLHTQNITRRWNIALNMLRIRSEGFYLHQNCTDNNITVSTNYVSKDNRFSLLGNGAVSSIKSEENGGITSDSLFDANLLENKKLIPVNLTDARSKRLYRQVYIKPSLHFGKKVNEMKGDSVISSRIHPATSLSFLVSASDNMFGYMENKLDSDYYEHNFFDTIRTLDSTHIEEFLQGLEFQTVLLKRIKIELGLDQKNLRFVQYNADSSRGMNAHFSDQIVKMGIGNAARKEKSKGLFWSIGKHYIVKGNHQGDDYVFGALGWIFNRNKKLSFEYTNAYRSVPFLYNEYTSNHFMWRNSFDKATEVRINLNYTDLKNRFSAGYRVNQITGYVYFDSTFFPQQYEGTVAIYSAFIQKKLRFGHFNFNNKITWQSVSSDIIRLPQFVTGHSFYYEGKWFRKATGVQLGFDITYYSSYYGDAYMPALGHYYLQNEKMLGDYPFIDFFFKLHLKRADIFFKSEHVNSGFMGGNYFLAPHMPAPDRSIKVGVKWMFFD